MKLSRNTLLELLQVIGTGAAIPPRMVVLEQSDCFVFGPKQVIAFNDEILARAKTPFDFQVVVGAADLLKVIEKLPDKELTVGKNDTELVIKGRSRTAGITLQQEVTLPHQGVPRPKLNDWVDLPSEAKDAMLQAAQTCGRDLSNPLTTVVHLHPERIESCDNFRLFRCDIASGVKEAILVPAFSIQALNKIEVNKIAIRGGWLHFKTPDKVTISVRCMEGDYLDLGAALKIGKSQKVDLPKNLHNIINRASIMADKTDMLLKVKIMAGRIEVTSRKESGWYKERKVTKYEGPTISFLVNPNLLADILTRTRSVRIGKDKMKIKLDNSQYVVSLESK